MLNRNETAVDRVHRHPGEQRSGQETAGHRAEDEVLHTNAAAFCHHQGHNRNQEVNHHPKLKTTTLRTWSCIAAVLATQKALNRSNAAGVGVEAGNRGAEHRRERSWNDHPSRPTTHGCGVELDQLLGKGHPAAGKHSIARAVHRVGAKRDEKQGRHHRDAIAKVEVEFRFRRAGGVLGVASTGKHPQRWPHTHLHRSWHPTHQGDQKRQIRQRPRAGICCNPTCSHVTNGAANQQRHGRYTCEKREQGHQQLGQTIQSFVMA